MYYIQMTQVCFSCKKVSFRPNQGKSYEETSDPTIEKATCLSLIIGGVFDQIGSLEDHYHFYHRRVVRRALYSLKGPHSFIHMDPKVSGVQCTTEETWSCAHFPSCLKPSKQSCQPQPQFRVQAAVHRGLSNCVAFISSVHQWCENTLHFCLFNTEKTDLHFSVEFKLLESYTILYSYTQI